IYVLRMIRSYCLFILLYEAANAICKKFIMFSILPILTKSERSFRYERTRRTANPYLEQQPEIGCVTGRLSVSYSWYYLALCLRYRLRAIWRGWPCNGAFRGQYHLRLLAHDSGGRC